MRAPILLCAVAITLAARLLGAQGASDSTAATISGSVLGPNGEPLGGVTVEVLGLASTRSDSAGEFRFTGAPEGVVLIRAAKLGYRPWVRSVQIRAGKDYRVSVELEPTAQNLPAVDVHANAESWLMNRMSGFDDRRRRATGGVFLSAADIERKHPIDAEDVFRGLPFVNVDTGGIIVIKRGEISFRDYSSKPACVGAQVILDGIQLPQPFDIKQIEPTRISGIEVYYGPATTPSLLRTSHTTCGTIAIWTK